MSCLSHSEAIPELSTPDWQPYPSLTECIDTSLVLVLVLPLPLPDVYLPEAFLVSDHLSALFHFEKPKSILFLQYFVLFFTSFVLWLLTGHKYHKQAICNDFFFPIMIVKSSLQ